MNCSIDTPACFKMPRSVPIANSGCSGITQPLDREVSDRLSTTWLPRCRTCVKPSFSMARIACAPETRGNLGKSGLEDGDERSTVIHERKFLEVQFGRFLQVGDCLFDGFALADGAHLRTFGTVEFLFFVQYRREWSYGH